MNDIVETIFNQEVSVGAKQFLVKNGEFCDKLFYIKKGSVRFWHTLNGKEKTTQLFFEGKIFASTESFWLNEPCIGNIETIEACELRFVTKADFDTYLKAESHMKDSIYQKFIQTVVINSREVSSLLSTKPEERYAELQRSQPNITNRVPQNIIASYLGITTVSLSRIKKRNTEK